HRCHDCEVHRQCEETTKLAADDDYEGHKDAEERRVNPQTMSANDITGTLSTSIPQSQSVESGRQGRSSDEYTDTSCFSPWRRCHGCSQASRPSLTKASSFRCG